MTEINDLAFYDCCHLKTISFGKGIKAVGKDAFLGCSNLEKVVITDISTWCGITFDGVDSNPTCLSNRIYDKAGIEITDLTIPSDVTIIRRYAFRNCLGLSSLTISEGVQCIEALAFNGCSFTSAIIPDSVTEIGDGAFSNCRSLSSIKIPKEITQIKSHVFENCSKIVSVEMSNHVTNIGNYAFYGCLNLYSIRMPQRLRFIGIHTFAGCQNLQEIGFSNDITEIHKTAREFEENFESCTIELA